MSTQTMQALRTHEFGSPAALRLESVPCPAPKADELLVEVRAAGINRSDVGMVAGRFKQVALPRTPGRDFAGVVLEGERMRAGTEVWGSGAGLGFMRDGTHAEYVLVPGDAARPKPRNLSMEQAGAVGVPYLTAFIALVQVASIRRGEQVLIIGASGAVGRAAVQVARWKGAGVIAADRTQDNRSGAESYINVVEQRLPDAVRLLTKEQGVDVVLDAVGGPMFELALQSLGKGGRQVAITSAGDRRVSFDLVDFYHNQSRLLGLDTLSVPVALSAAVLDELRRGFEEGTLVPPPLRTYSPTQAGDAYEAVGKGGSLERHVLIFGQAE